MVQLTDKQHWAVEVPDGAEGIQLSDKTQEHDNAQQWILFYLKEGNLQPLKSLPPGTWQFLFTTKGCTEEQAASVVQLISTGKISGRPQYRRYDRDPIKDLPAKCWTRDSRHSLETLLLSKGCDINKNWAIIQKL